MKVLTFAALAVAQATRYPRAGQDLATVNLSAAEESPVELQAAAVKTFSVVNGKLVWVKASSNFFVAGELVPADSFVQVQERLGKQLIATGQAEPATDAEVADAQKQDE